MRVIGTAGHVDHGKSTLVQALTGVHPDRLKEEREREMTIDLGFAFFTLPGGEPVGVVDVPGHRDFIENMLAGVGGIDAVIFVVAADEGVMPQTREHLAILNLLDIPGGVVALTKVDMVDDPEWLDLVEMELREVLESTSLAEAPILRVSARDGTGIDGLLDALDQVLSGTPVRPDLGKPRLPVDRVFTLPGFGTIVTGTLLDGRLEVGSEVEILPRQMRGRIRGLQSHNQKEKEARAGSRTAVNISGVSLEEIERGDWIARPGTYRPTRRLDLQVTLLKDASRPLKHNAEVKLFLGAAEVIARARVLGVEQIRPGEHGWLQLELKKAVIARRGDRFILRRPSPGETIGGGSVLDPHPARRHKRFRRSLIERLEALAAGTPEDVLQETLNSRGFAIVRELESLANLEETQFSRAMEALLAEGTAIRLDTSSSILPESLLAAPASWEAFCRDVLESLEAYHREQPLRTGMPREALRSKLGLPASIFNPGLGRLVGEGQIVDSGGIARLPEHSIAFSSEQKSRIRTLETLIEKNPYAPPTVRMIQEDIGEPAYAALLELGRLVQVSDDVAFRTQDYEKMLETTKSMIQAKGSITVAEFRDRFGTSRKYALAFLEHLDASRVTVRQGDKRKLL